MTYIKTKRNAPCSTEHPPDFLPNFITGGWFLHVFQAAHRIEEV
jgi:hypothetical protein